MSASPLTPFIDLRTSLGLARVGDGGSAVCALLTEAMDTALQTLAVDLGPGAAVVALGGYGRSEQCLWSDIDVMLLHDGGDPDPLVRALLYPLWDANLKVGHAVRTVAESREAGRDQFDTLTSLLSARLVAGDANLFEELMEVVADLVRTRPLGPALMTRERERRRIDPYPTMTADLKEGRGALRTHQGFWWQRRRAALLGFDVDDPSDDERSALAILLSIRNALHAAAGRASDRFVVDLRAPAASWLGAEVHSLAASLTEALDTGDRLADRRWPDLHAENDPMVGLGRRIFGVIRSRFTSPDSPADHTDTVLALAVRAAGRVDGARFETFEEEAIRRAPLTPWTETDRTSFVTLLSAGARGRSVFNRLIDLGWVDRVFPEWATVATAPQIVPFHDHPVGAHLWRTVDEMLALIEGGGEPGAIATEIGSTEELLLAAFLHDIGKGRGGNHENVGADIATVFLRRTGFGPATIGVVADVIRLHLVMSETATRRDIADPTVVDDVAAMVGDLRTLQVLYLLTIADLTATGTTMWNEWRATLVRSLYFRVAAAIEAGGAPPATRDVVAIMNAGGGEIDRRVVEEHVAAMPSDYLDTTSPQEVLWHLEMAEVFEGTASVSVDPANAGRILVVGTDRSGFLLAVSRAFTANAVEVLDARLRTRTDGLAIDTFHVRDQPTGAAVPKRRWPVVDAAIVAALSEDHDLRPAIRERAAAYRRSATTGGSVDIRGGREGVNTVIEVRAPDRVGLMTDIIEALHNEGLDIHLAKIDTMGAEARDVFHVRRVGVPIHVESELAALIGRLRDRLTP